jgi:RNA polymerase sigma-70 factor (ECF subfamily)
MTWSGMTLPDTDDVAGRIVFEMRHSFRVEAELERGRTEAAEPQAASEVLDSTLLDIINEAQQTYPTIMLPRDVFAAYLGDRLPAEVPPLRALRQMYTADLYLACACARGDVLAFAAFDDRCLRQLDRALLRMGIDAAAIADVKQDIRSRVLIGDGRPPQIVDFAGYGDLRGWVRVMAIRRALQRQGRAHRELPLEDDRLADQLVGSSPESDYAKRIYRQEFNGAFERALQELPDRERTLLSQHYIDGLTIDELGTLYRVHRSTAARLVDRARFLVLEATRAQMMSRLDVQSQDLDSIIRMIRSQIEISLDGLRRRRKR